MLTKKLIAALDSIAEETEAEAAFQRLSAALERFASPETGEDKGTSEGAKKGWETRRHGRPSIWDEVKTRVASPEFKDFRKKLGSVSGLKKVQDEVERLGGFGTFDVETGEPITTDQRERGYQVSFCTTTTEDPNHENYLDDGAFDSTVEEMARQTGSKPEVGVYKGGHEISFHVRTRKQALQLMRYHNQQSGLRWGMKKVYEDAVKNDPQMSEDEKNALFDNQFEPNPFFDPSENQV